MITALHYLSVLGLALHITDLAGDILIMAGVTLIMAGAIHTTGTGGILHTGTPILTGITAIIPITNILTTVITTPIMVQGRAWSPIQVTSRIQGALLTARDPAHTSPEPPQFPAEERLQQEAGLRHRVLLR